MKKELNKINKNDVTRTSHALRYRDLREIVSVCRGTVYINFGDTVPIPKRERFKDNYRLAMAIRLYYRTNERQLNSRRSFAALLTLIQHKLLTQARYIEDTVSAAAFAKVIDKKAIAILQQVYQDLAEQ